MDGRPLYEGTFFFDPSDKIYAHHFPANPVVPGSLIVHAFIEAAERMAGKRNPDLIKQFKFKRFISPGEYPFQIRIAADEIRCTLFDKKEIVTTGKLIYET